MEVKRLPKPVIIRYMATEQGMLAKYAAHQAIMKSVDPITSHTDGTKKKAKHFITHLTTTDFGTVGLSLDEVLTETSDELVKTLDEALQEITRLTGMSGVEKTHEVEEMVSKIKNTMSDRAAVNKAYVRKLGEWREQILPNIVENWGSLSDEAKQEMIEINDLYCGKHLVLNLQEYASTALYEWEKVLPA